MLTTATDREEAELPVTMDEEVIEEIEKVEAEVKELDGEEGADAEAEKENLEALEEAMIEATFPPGCSWKCYLARYDGLMDNLPHTEEAALKHWLEDG